MTLKNTGLVVPAHLFDPPWSERDWYQFALALLQLLPSGSAFAFTQARRHRGPMFAKLHDSVGSYSMCPPVVQEALFFERRDIQHTLEHALSVFYSLMPPRQATELIAAVLVPWLLPHGTVLAGEVCDVARAAEIVAIPGTTIRFWQHSGVTVLPCEQYVIFVLLLFAAPWGYINREPPSGTSALHTALHQVWSLTPHTPTTATKSPRGCCPR